MALPRIEALETATLASVPTEYPDLYLTNLRVMAEPDKPWAFHAKFVPYNYEANVLMPGNAHTSLAVADIRTKAAEYPGTVGVMLGSMIALLPMLLREQEIGKQIAALGEEPDAGELATLEAQLAAVQAQLAGE